LGACGTELEGKFFKMFTISEKQIASFQSDATMRFCKKIDIFLRDNFENAKESKPGSLDIAIENQIKKAQKYGMSTERQIITYVLTAWILGESFDKFNSPSFVLNSNDYSPEDRRLWLINWVVNLCSCII